MKKLNWKSLIPHAIAVGIFLIIAVVYCKPALQGKLLQQSDITQWKAMAAQSMRYKDAHGHLPLWTNSIFAGMPGYQIALESSNPLAPTYLDALFTLFLPRPISFFFLMCVSFYFLTQVFRIDYRLGILGAIAYAYASFSPIIVTVGHDSQAAALGYVPALLGAVFLVFRKKYLIGGALTAIFTALLIGQNHPQISYYFILVAFFAAIAYLIVWIRSKEYKHIAVSIGVLAVAGLLGVGVNMVTLATTLDFSKATMRNGTLNLDTTGKATRQSSGLPISYAFQWSYGPTETFTLLTPNIYGGAAGELGADSHFAKAALDKGVPDDQAAEIAASFPGYWGNQPGTSGPVYVGAIICFLFIFGLFYLKGFDKWWILAVCILAILMSWGSNLMGFNSFLFNNMPLYNKFRAPTMSLVVPQLLFPLVAIMALQQFIFDEKDKAYAWKKLRIAGLAMAGIFLVLGMLYTSFDYKSATADGEIQQNLMQMTRGNEDIVRGLVAGLKEDRKAQFGSDLLRSVIFAGLAFLAMWALLKNKLKPTYALLALVLLSSVDVLAEGRRYLNDDKFADAETVTDDHADPTPLEQQILKDTGFFRVLNQTRDYHQDAYTSYHLNSIGGYSPAKLSVTEDLLNYQLGGRQLNVQVLNMLNTKYVIVQGEKGEPVTEQNPGALGNCWFVKAIDYVPGPAEAMKALNNFNPKDTAIIETSFKSLIPFTPVADSTASIKLVKNDNDDITYTSSSKTNQLAVFSEIYYGRGWKAYVDGKESPIIKADYALRALALPAGNHSIHFEFKPASFYDSVIISNIASIITWIVVIGAIVIAIRRRPVLESTTKKEAAAK